MRVVVVSAAQVGYEDVPEGLPGVDGALCDVGHSIVVLAALLAHPVEVDRGTFVGHQVHHVNDNGIVSAHLDTT